MPQPQNPEQIALNLRAEAAKARLKALRPEERPVFGLPLIVEADKSASGPLKSKTEQVMDTLPKL